MTHARQWRIGTRQSQLALKQTEMVREQLQAATSQGDHQMDDYAVVSMTTTGDRQLNRPLHQLGGKALFTKELEQALMDDEVCDL